MQLGEDSKDDMTGCDDETIFDETIQSHRINPLDPEPGLRRATAAYMKSPDKFAKKNV